MIIDREPDYPSRVSPRPNPGRRSALGRPGRTSSSGARTARRAAAADLAGPGTGEIEPVGCISVHEDRDHDGNDEKHNIFVRAIT